MMPSLVAPLFVPGNRPDQFPKAGASGANAVIYDLEDAVSPGEKDIARMAIARRPQAFVYEIVRVNAMSSGLLNRDLEALSAKPPSAVMVAKTEGLEDLEKVVTKLGSQIALIPLIETARGMARLSGILAVGNILCAAFGSIDFALDIGSKHERLALLSARSELVLQSRLANRQSPIDGVTMAIDDAMAIKDDASHAKALGFGGKLAIHPRQIEPILSAFSATDEEVAWAKHVLQLALDGNAQKVDGQMIDRPVLERARSILAVHKTMPS
ncbi:HpcH/HpaI aldolase/citrate lyase family protein [Brucella cytisi]|uniref:HpcH/HpaI aldolase/citrate lyase family protein n=1 Tax=Brucella cytisi TaxID=407152 RepID=UPI0035DEF3D4